MKTGTDADAHSVSLSPIPQTISYLAGLPSQASPPANNRIAPTELQAVILTNVEVTEIKSESDNDYHLVLSDGAGNTMIGEVPYPGCVGMGSPFECFITHARGSVDTIGTTASTHYATIIGVPFFDFKHGQTGVAPNAIELHPILSICFGQNCTVPTSYLRLHDHQDDAYLWILPPPFQQIPAAWMDGIFVDDEEEERDDEFGHQQEREGLPAADRDEDERHGERR